MRQFPLALPDLATSIQPHDASIGPNGTPNTIFASHVYALNSNCCLQVAEKPSLAEAISKLLAPGGHVS
jgi:hypothetical protein